jgi:uncharacterized protein YndB with AHSA1/START domain
MSYEFQVAQDLTVPASPEVLWNAISTGPGIDSWFMGRNEVTPGQGGTVRTVFGQYVPECSITDWQPNERLAYRTDAETDGRFIAYEFLIEARDAGSTVLRMVTSGFLPGDDWEDEYEAMSRGLQMFLRTLGEYVTHFAGRTATAITAFGPQTDHWRTQWRGLHGALGLTVPAGPGDRVRIAPDGLPPVDGVVFFSNTDTVGIRTAEGLYRFLGGYRGPIVGAHHVFTENVDVSTTESAWQNWLAEVLA